MPAPGWKKKTKSPSGVGLALVNDRRAAQKSHEDAAGKAGKGAALQSVLETRDLDAVLEKAELAGRIFAAENPVPRLLVDAEGSRGGGASSAADAKRRRHEEESLHKASLTVPRRPKWSSDMSAEALNAEEQRSFLNWRRGLAQLELNESLVVTPFEKNLDVWRQLWRVLERSDLVVVVVDARNPLYYRCPDLEAYVREIDGDKDVMVLLNKADLLSPASRREWVAYFDSVGLPFLFWSAKDAASVLEGKIGVSADGNSEGTAEDDDNIRVLERDELLRQLQRKAEDIVERQRQRAGAALAEHLHQENGESELERSGSSETEASSAHSARRRVVVGFVGYPNVGKSSTINALVGAKRTGVTSTPGKTKHFQTLIMSDQLMLCDCPGLVFPSFSSSKSEMVASGVVPIDKLTDHRGPVQVVADTVGRLVLEEVYKIVLPKPKLYEDQSRPPSAAELLSVVASSRGYFSNSGLPDETRVARLILKDYISGKLPFFHSPPRSETPSSPSDAVEDPNFASSNDDDVDVSGSNASSEEDGEEGEEGEEVSFVGGTRTAQAGTYVQPTTSSAEPDSETFHDNLLGVIDDTDENLARAFADLDSNSAPDRSDSRRDSKAVGAPHKMHKKAARRKDRTWRAGRTKFGDAPVVNGVKVPVSHGAADRYQVQVFD